MAKRSKTTLAGAKEFTKVRLSIEASDAAWSRDGEFLAVWGHEGLAVLEGNLNITTAIGGPVYFAAWSPKSSLAAATEKGVVVSHGVSFEFEPVYDGSVHLLAWWGTDRLVLLQMVGDEKGKLIELPVVGKPLGPTPIKAPADPTVLSPSPDGSEFAVGFKSGTVRFLGSSGRKTLRALAEHVRDIAWNNDGSLLAVAYDEGPVALWNSETGKLYRRLDVAGPLWSVSFSHDDRVLVAASHAGNMWMWCMQDGSPIDLHSRNTFTQPAVAMFNPCRPVLATIPMHGNTIGIFDMDLDLIAPAVEHRAETKGSEHVEPRGLSFGIAMKALSDVPVENPEDDMLNYQQYADALVDLIRQKSTDTPLTLGIDAPWGLGKSSIMNMMGKELDRYGIICVWFNAWRYEDASQLWVALAQTVLDTVKQRMEFWQRIGFNLRLALSRIDRERVEHAGLFWALRIVLVAVLVAVVSVLVFTPAWDEVFDVDRPPWAAPAGGVLTLAGIGWVFRAWRKISQVVNPFTLRLSRLVADPKYSERAAFMDVFRADFRRIVELVHGFGQRRFHKRPDEKKPPQHELGDPGRLVIFVDDLDRCSPPRSVDIVEAINVILDAEHCVWVLGMDSDMVRASIETKYGSLLQYLRKRGQGADPRLGHRFLEKIVQINFRIPPPDKDGVNDYFNSLSPKDDGEAPRVEDRAKVDKESSRLAKVANAKLEDVGNIREVVEEEAKKLGDGKDAPEEVVDQAVRQVAAKRYTSESPHVREAIAKVVEHMDPNPRKIKRFVNIFRLRAMVAEQRATFDKHVTLTHLARWIFLGMDWPEVVLAAQREPDVLVNLVQSANGTKPTDEQLDKLGVILGARVQQWGQDADLRRFLATWEAGLSPETVEKLRWR